MERRSVGALGVTNNAADFLEYSSRGYKNANLIATSKSNHPAHDQVIESVGAALRRR
jgi:hypothetical protein